MIIHVEICDHCDAATRGVPFTSYVIEGESTVLHICASCEQKPFIRVQQSQRGSVLSKVLAMALDDKATRLASKVSL